MRNLAATIMLGLLLLATTAGKYSEPSGGMFLFNADSTKFSTASADTVIDSLRCPNGQTITKIVLRSAAPTTQQKIRLGVVHNATPTGSIAEVDEWCFVVGDPGGALGNYDWGRTFNFFNGAEKVYLKSATTAGSWQWEAYSVPVQQDARSVQYPLAAETIHSPETQGTAIFKLYDVETDYGEDMYFRISSVGGLGGDESMVVFLMTSFNTATVCPMPNTGWTNTINWQYCVGYALDVDSSSTVTTVQLEPTPKHTEFNGAVVSYTGLGRYANGGATIQGTVWEYIE